ncbi:prohead core protein [Serratia phage SP1]|nr:prohead core protein [Serratia phage SP1]
MLTLPEGIEVSIDGIEKRIPEATERLSHIKELDESVINTIIQNTMLSEAETACAMLSVYHDEPINEVLVKRVNSSGQVSRVKDRKTRQRNAFQTTGLSKSKRRQIARKAAKTKRANPSIKTRANRKRKKAMKKRAALGL